MSEPVLFPVAGIAEQSADRVSRRDGSLEVAWSVGRRAIPDRSWTSRGVEIHAWEAGAVSLELALSDYEPELIEEQQVRCAWIAVIRGRASPRGPLTRRSPGSARVPEIRCAITQPPADLEGGGDSGEHLDAQTWDVDGSV